MKEYRVILPEEKYQIIEFVQEGMPGVALVNSALKEFEPKLVFAWHCSIVISYNDVIENGMPSLREREIVDEFEVSLADRIKGVDKKKPNALFLARITWNKTRELIWRIYNPDITNQLLQKVISNKELGRSYDYRIDPDEDWTLAEWHLQNR